MAWVRLDDHFDENTKLQAAGPLGVALWTCSLAYCNRNLTDGFIPKSKAHTLLDFDGLAMVDGMHGEDITGAMIAKKLVDVGLYEVVEGGYIVHDYLDYQPSKAEIEAQRQHVSEERSKAGQAGAKSRWDGKNGKAIANGLANDMPNACQSDGPKPNPNPKPNPTPNTEREREKESLPGGDPDFANLYTAVQSKMTPNTSNHLDDMHAMVDAGVTAEDWLAGWEIAEKKPGLAKATWWNYAKTTAYGKRDERLAPKQSGPPPRASSAQQEPGVHPSCVIVGWNGNV